MNGGGGATKIYKRKYKYLFGLISPVELLGTTLMQWIDEQQKAGKLPKPAKIALVWENTAHGKDFRKGVSDFASEERRRVPDRGRRVVRAERQGLRRAAREGEGAGADLFLVDAHLPDYITMHRQYRRRDGLCHKVVAYGARGAERTRSQALGAGERVTTSSPASGGAPSSRQTRAVEGASSRRSRRSYGGPTPEWFQALGYESARALFAAIQQAGSGGPRGGPRDAAVGLKVRLAPAGREARLQAELGSRSRTRSSSSRTCPTAPRRSSSRTTSRARGRGRRTRAAPE